MTKIIFIDPNYLVGVGHYEAYGRALRNGDPKTQVTLRHYVSLSVPIEHAGQNSLIRWFHRNAIENPAFDLTEEEDYKIECFANRLRSLIKREKEHNEAHEKIKLFFYTGHLSYMPVVSEVINDTQFDALDLEFHFNIFYVSNSFALKRQSISEYHRRVAQIAKDAEAFDEKNRLRLHSDSHRTINIYQKFFSRPISLIPIPIAHNKSENVEKTPNTLTLGFAGLTQRKQGYDYLLRLANDVSKISSATGRRILLKIRHRIFNIDYIMLQDLREIVATREGVENSLGFTSIEEHREFLKGIDLLLIPHDAGQYPVQTSGTLVEALSLGKPVVVPDNTWLGDVVNRYQSGVTYGVADYESFFRAVVTAVENYDSLRESAERGSVEVCRYHTVENLFNVITSIDLVNDCPTVEAMPVDCLGTDKIQLLDLSIVKSDTDLLRFIYDEKILRRRNLGWHYILDLFWILHSLRDLPRGSLVLDAGAGDGLLQYLLIKSGMRVVSVDFVRRDPPKDIKSRSISCGSVFDNDYVGHLRSNYSISNHASSEEIPNCSPIQLTEMLSDKELKLVFYRSDLRAMSAIPDNYVDAVVSVSALEHNPIDDSRKAFTECLRVLKFGGQSLITTSATDKESWFHEPSMGWCYSERTLREIFQLPETCEGNFSNFEDIFSRLSELGNELHVQLSPFYFASQNNGMPGGRWRPQYVPVGVRKIKRAQGSHSNSGAVL